MGQAPDDDLSAAEREVEELRERTEALVLELERRFGDGLDRARGTIERVKRATNVPAQVRAHPRVAAGVGTGLLLAVGVGLWIGVSRRREAQRPINRLRRKAGALRALWRDPEAMLAQRESLRRRVGGAVLMAFVTVAARALATRAVRRVALDRPAPRALPAPRPR